MRDFVKSSRQTGAFAFQTGAQFAYAFLRNYAITQSFNRSPRRDFLLLFRRRRSFGARQNNRVRSGRGRIGCLQNRKDADGHDCANSVVEAHGGFARGVAKFDNLTATEKWMIDYGTDHKL